MTCGTGTSPDLYFFLLLAAPYISLIARLKKKKVEKLNS